MINEQTSEKQNEWIKEQERNKKSTNERKYLKQ